MIPILAIFGFSILYSAGEGRHNKTAIQIILGEAADQSFAGKIAVGEVIRRRKDFTAFSSTQKNLKKFYNDQPPLIRAQARWAWIFSRFTDIAQGADHFDNVRAFGEPAWAKGMKKTIRIGDTQFYQSKNLN